MVRSIVHNFRQGRGGTRGQFFSGWIFGKRPDMSRMGESAVAAAAVLAMENGGEGEDCECEMHRASIRARVG